MRLAFVFLLLGASAATAAGCAENECSFHSQCGPRHYCQGGSCKQDCRVDTDCASGLECGATGRCVADAGTFDAGSDAHTPLDGGVDAGPEDSGSPPTDSGNPPEDSGSPPEDSGNPPEDSGAPPEDSGAGGDGAYLDRCTGDGDCASGHCVGDLGTTRYCTRECSNHGQCAQGHVCAGDGLCRPDDTGAACSLGSPEACTLGLCVGAGTGQCTRPCNDASDCPAGYACSTVPGETLRVCLDIEKPCTAGGDECATGLCFTDLGCSAPCRTAADCPATLESGGVPPYTCESRDVGGETMAVCIPPDGVVGDNAIGQACELDAGGSNQCRSAVCNDAAPLGPMCTQACDSGGGCAIGFGCKPEPSGSDILLVCARAGSGDLGESCGSASDCRSALCDADTGRCTRFCNDGRCPTGWTCQPVGGYGFSICRP